MNDGKTDGGGGGRKGRREPARSQGRRRPATGSVTGRALSVLEAFSPAAPVLKLTDIARHADLPLTTAHRLVGDLLDWGALEREPGGGYRIGLRLWEIAALAPRALGLRELALPFMSDLGAVTRENVQLAVREET